MKVDPEAWPILSRLMDEWLDLPPEQRDEWLANLGPEHANILPVLHELLSQPNPGFLDVLPQIHDEPDADPSLTPHAEGMLAGSYRLVRELGRGGMGVVWLAVRSDGALKRDVAIKFPHFYLQSQTLADRFERERDILARLSDARIARLYDTGMTAQGQPYLVLEYVEGEAITAYCDRVSLNIRARLNLFLEVLGAVQYAHANLVVHRDLKPSNILVTKTGEVRLLDFGIAKLLEEGEAQETEITRLGGRAMTPDFASPEQLAGGVITTATDVYSLGILLYGLLAGRRPEQRQRENPPRPSQAADEKRKPALRGDLDSIVLKAIQTEPQMRYSTADAFAQDIERYLSGLPVQARPESAWYRARKFVLRNRLAVAAGMAIALALAIGAGIALRQKWRADNEAATARAVSDFLQNDLLSQAGPSTKPDPDLKVRTALDRAAGRITQKFGRQPLLEASIRQTIGNAYIDLGLYPEAEKHMERAMDLRRRLLGGDHIDTLSVMNDLEMLYRDEGKYAQAEPLARKVLENRRRSLGGQHPDTLDAMNNLGLLVRAEGNPAQAEEVLSKVLEIRQRLSGEEDLATLYAMNNLAVVYQVQGKYTQAEAVLSKALEIRRRVSGPDHPDTLIVTDNLGTVYYRQRKYAQAESLWARNLEIRRRVLGEEHPDTLDSIQNLGAVYRAEGEFAQAETLLTTAMEAKRRVLGEEHPFTLTSMFSLAVLYRYEGKYSRAEPLMVRAAEVQRRVLGEQHPDRLAGMNRLAALYSDEQKYPEAEALFTNALKVQRRVLGEDHPETLSSRDGLGRVQLREHKYVEAESTLRDALKEYDKVLPESWERYNCQSMLGASLQEQKKYAEAEPFLVSGYKGEMQRQAAVPLQDRRVLSEAKERIVQLYKAWERPGKAAEWRKEFQAK